MSPHCFLLTLHCYTIGLFLVCTLPSINLMNIVRLSHCEHKSPIYQFKNQFGREYPIDLFSLQNGTFNLSRCLLCCLEMKLAIVSAGHIIALQIQREQESKLNKCGLSVKESWKRAHYQQSPLGTHQPCLSDQIPSLISTVSTQQPLPQNLILQCSLVIIHPNSFIHQFLYHVSNSIIHS